MSLEGVGISVLWKPISFLLGIIGALLLLMWNALQGRIKGVEQKADTTENKLAGEYYSKPEANAMIELHIKPLVQSLNAQTQRLDRLCDSLEKRNKD